MASQGKRPVADVESGDEPVAKRICLDYGKTINVGVCSLPYNTTGMKLPGIRQIFSVDEKLLLENSPFIKAQIGYRREKREYELSNTDPTDFKLYLDWIYSKALTADSTENGAGDVLRRLQQCKINQDSQSNYGVSGLCNLLRLCIKLQTDDLRSEVLTMLGERALNILPGSVGLSVGMGSMLWNLRNKKEANFIRRRIPEWMARLLTREKLEELSEVLDSSLLEALRKLLPRTELTIQIGNGPEVQKVTVPVNLAIARSQAISKAMDGTPYEEAQTVTWRKGFLDEAGVFHLPGICAPGVLEEWAHTLVTKGNELEKLFARYPSYKTFYINKKALRSKLCEMWILAEALGDSEIQRKILAGLLSLPPGKHSGDMHLSTVHTVNASVRPPGGLRRWMVDSIASTIIRWGNLSTINTIPPDMLKEVFIRTEEIRGKDQNHVGPQPSDLDKYCNPA